MADEQIDGSTGGTSKKDDTVEKVCPTLFIGIGGTGMEVLLRVRRHILNSLWGPASNRTRIDSLTDFPVAQFINFDLDVGATVESGKSQKLDALYDSVKFTEEERIVERFDIDKYCRDDDSLAKYPHIEKWSPLTPKDIRDTGIRPEDGAGQIRGISRLYFFDKYYKIKDRIRLKLQNLQAGLSSDSQLKRLDLELEQEKYRIVVVCSGAGGTGSGSFLDMGWLASWMASSTVGKADVDLVLFTPAGFQKANKDETEANGYAALMELETAMRGGAVGQYLTRWDAYDKPVLSPTPYSGVYLVEMGNLAQQYTQDIKDVYQMVADTLFENFASAQFASQKRSVGVNQKRHKVGWFSPPVPEGRYGQMKLTFYKGYSAFGQSVLDTQQTFRDDMRAHVWAGEMLKAFFGVATGDAHVNRSTDKQRDDFLADRMLLSAMPFSDFPEFSSKNIDLKRSNGDFNDYVVVEELLKDKQGSLVAGMQQKIDGRVEGVKSGFKRDEWVAQVREVVKQMERDAIRDQDATAEVVEDRIARHRTLLFAQTKERVREQLYAYLDNKEFGGLEYVLSLVEQIKDRLANSSTGLISQLAGNATRYEEIKDAVRTHEYERLMGNLAQAKGGMFGSGEKQSLVIMDQLKTEIANFLKFHLRAKAAHESAAMMADLSKWLGEKTGVDSDGRPTWNGLVGELQSGREAVIEMVDSLGQSIENLRQDLKKDHATYIYVKADEDKVPLPSPALLREWADESFKDIGGSKVLFQMLTRTEDRASLLGKVRRMAERQIAAASGTEVASDVDPLVKALDAMGVEGRRRRFTELIGRAMPWIDANLQGDFTVRADQFKCFLGVHRASDYPKEWRDEINACVPTKAGITAMQLGIFDTGIPGRAICYCEITGVPLAVLRGLEPWRTSYRKVVDQRVPIHTHSDYTLFQHPFVRVDELNALAADFKYYLLAVMTGILVRTAQKDGGAASYQFTIRPGEKLRIGNERIFRRDGLPLKWRDKIVNSVNDRVDAFSRTQLATLAVLSGRYEAHVYAPKRVKKSNVEDEIISGFAHTLSAEVTRELVDRSARKGLSTTEFERFKDRALEQLSTWATPIQGSDADAYEWEVGDADAESGLRLKYVVRKEYFQIDSDDKLTEILGLRSQEPKAANPPPINVGLGAPPLPTAAQYMLAINGQQAGPYTQANVQQFVASGQINQTTLVWRQGLSDWLPLAQVPELAGPPPLPTGIPPLPAGPPPLPGRVQ